MSVWDKSEYDVKIKLLEPMLGTLPLQESIWESYMAGKMTKQAKKDGLSASEIKERIEADLDCLPDELDTAKGLTGFLRNAAGEPVVNDYFIKGFFKSAAHCLKQYGTTKQLQDKVRKYLFITPRQIVVGKPDEELAVVERPLRAQTPQGERTAIARSQAIPAGREIAFRITVLQEMLTDDLVKGLLEYGSFMGLGQFRSGSYGQFEVVKFKEL